MARIALILLFLAQLSWAEPLLYFYRETIYDNSNTEPFRKKDLQRVFNGANEAYWRAVFPKEKGTQALFSASPKDNKRQVYFFEVFHDRASLNRHNGASDALTDFNIVKTDIMVAAERLNPTLAKIIVMAERKEPVSSVNSVQPFLYLETFTLKNEVKLADVIAYLKNQVWTLRGSRRAIYIAQDSRNPRTFYYLHLDDQSSGGDAALHANAKDYQLLALDNRLLFTKGGAITYIGK